MRSTEPAPSVAGVARGAWARAETAVRATITAARTMWRAARVPEAMRFKLSPSSVSQPTRPLVAAVVNVT